MLDTYGRKYVNPIIDIGARSFLKVKLKPNHITILAFLIGLSNILFIYLDKQGIAVLMLWISGYFDAVDGAMARISKKTSNLGTLMDITFDRVVEMAVVLGIALKVPEVRMNLIVLVMCILFSMTIFLTVGALAENSGMKSFHYQAGLAERTEGFIMFSIMILSSESLALVINIFSVIIVITIMQRLLEARRLLS